MHKLRLLERIKAWETGQISRFNSSNESDLLASIINHLDKMLNTKQGGVKLDNNYGIPEFHDLTPGVLEKYIRDIITNYEPRLEVIEVARTLLKDDAPSNIKISIVAKIKGKDNVLSISTVLTSNGRVVINL